MADEIFDRETLLDLTVNAIPLGILLFFIVLFLVLSPFKSAPAIVVVQFAIMVTVFAALAALTYYAGKAISTAESELEAAESAVEPVENGE
jgi:hypothetical protein